MNTSLHIIYASTSGNTEFVVEEIVKYAHMLEPELPIEIQRAEEASAADLLRGDLLILGSGTWNTGGTEGQLNPHMQALLEERAKDLDLHGKPITFVSLGDDRYYFRTRCTEHFLKFQRDHQGTLIVPPLVIVNEPYDQDEKILAWTEKLLHTPTHEAPVGADSSAPLAE